MLLSPVVGLENDLCRDLYHDLLGPDSDLDLYYYCYDLDLQPGILWIFHVTWIWNVLDPSLLNAIDLADLHDPCRDLHDPRRDLHDLHHDGHDRALRHGSHGLLCLDCLDCSDLDGLSCLLCIHYS